MKHRFSPILPAAAPCRPDHTAAKMTPPSPARAFAAALLVAALVACGSEAEQPEHPGASGPSHPGAGASHATIDVGARHQLPSTALVATHDELLADLAATRHASDGGGRAWIEEGPTELGVRSRGRWSFLYEVGPGGIAKGGAVYFMVSPFWGWSPPQTHAPRQPGLVTFELLGEPEPGGTGAPVLGEAEVNAQLLIVPVEGRALEPGERLRLVYGAGEAMAISDSHAEAESRFWFAVDGDGDGVRGLVPDSPSIDILPGPAVRLELLLPGVARPGEEVRAVAALLDRAGNAGVNFEGELLVSGDKRWPVTPERMAIGPSAHGLVEFTFTLPEDAPEGILRIGAGAVSTEPDADRRGGRLMALSNPMLVSRSAPRILWADLHGHSNLSDGTGTPAAFYDYARRAARLDVAALTDHDHWGVEFLDQHPALWERITAAVRAADEPGTFTALLAYEWTSWLHGHRHVVSFEAAETATADALPLLSSIDADFDDPDELWAGLRGRAALTFAHHSAGGPVATNWSFPPDPVLEPITEVASVHGSSEAWDSPGLIYRPLRGNFVRDVLDAGYPLGFIGSGDSHDGHPGLAHLNSPSGGLAAILAERNERGELLDAMRARRTYATNGPRIVVDAQLAGAAMGSDVDAAGLDPSAALVVTLAGTEPLERLEVIRSGKVVRFLDAAHLSPSGPGGPGGPPDFSATLPLEDLGLADLEPGEYVYLRVVQGRTGLAWTSPWFIR
ncbi:MAG: DUF3604 domain-containing protein [Planctomycetota bacterium]|nr:DUF3604 domain-containing protein [Planctomycetota bacterium]